MPLTSQKFLYFFIHTSSDITVLADLTRIYEAGEKQLSYSVSFPGSAQNNPIEVVSRKPDSITLTVVEWASKEIPVELAYTAIFGKE